MSFIRTIRGDIDPKELGVCYSHEHIVIDESYATSVYPEFLLDSVELASRELAEFRRAGGQAMVDSMPCGAGRNIRKLAEVSERTGVHIVCPTGYHLAKYYPAGHWGARLTAAEMARVFTTEVNEGIDAYDCNGPWRVVTAHRAGVVKVASGLDGINELERKVFEAAAIAHRATGVPILTHAEEGMAGLEQVDLLDELGVSPYHVVVSHTDRRPDLNYHREMLSTGAFLEYDSAFRWSEEQGNPTRDLILEMVEDGFASQLLLGMDAARRGYWKSYGGAPGLKFLLSEFRGILRGAGVEEKHLHQIFVENPALAYRFRDGTEF